MEMQEAKKNCGWNAINYKSYNTCMTKLVDETCSLCMSLITFLWVSLSLSLSLSLSHSLQPFMSRLNPRPRSSQWSFFLLLFSFWLLAAWVFLSGSCGSTCFPFRCCFLFYSIENDQIWKLIFYLKLPWSVHIAQRLWPEVFLKKFRLV